MGIHTGLDADKLYDVTTLIKEHVHAPIVSSIYPLYKKTCCV